MTVGTGIECINLKKAKYNRDMRIAAASAVASAAVSASVSEVPSYGAARSSVHASAPVRTEKRRTTGVSVDDGNILKDLAGAIGGAMLGALSSYRRKKMRERTRTPKYIARNVKAKTAFPVSALGYIVVFSVIAMFLVLGNSRINEATLYANSLENEINEAVNTCEALTAEVNSRSDALAVEEYAVNVLGLVKNTDVAKTYISISGEDKIVLNGVAVASGTFGE